MKYVEYGKGNADVIVLLHGGGLSWWNYREAAEILQADYHVILPMLDGHAGSDRGFTTIESCALAVMELIDREFGGRVLMMGGLSLGGQVLLEVLSRRGDICRYALVESALAVPSKILHGMIGPAFGSCYGLICRRWFSKLQFKSLRIKEALFEDYFRDTRRITKPDMIAFLKANALYAPKDALGNCVSRVRVFVGQRENRTMRRSAQIISRRISGSSLCVLPGMHHGEFSINRPQDYADAVRAMMDEGAGRQDEHVRHI